MKNTIFNTGSGTIGDGVIFGHNCMVLTGKHNYDKNILRHDVPQGRNITIGSWIASGAMIMG